MTYIEPCTKKSVIIVSKMTENLVASETEYIITRKTAVIYNELVKRLIANDYDDIALTLKNGENIRILVKHDENAVTKDLSSIRWICIAGTPNKNPGSGSLVEIAAMLADYTKPINTKGEAELLNELYYEKIKGHSGDELEMGYSMLSEIERLGMTYDSYDECWAMDAFNVNLDVIENCLRLAVAHREYARRYDKFYNTNRYGTR